MKGGTSLSKGFDIIERFSEDIDIQFYPRAADNVKIGKNHDKPAHIDSRCQFFEKITNELNVVGLVFRRDPAFDDNVKMRGAGIRGEYSSLYSEVSSLKEGIVLELGFDQTTPNVPCNITSWAFEKAKMLNLPIIDNRAKQVPCYCPEYTFIEKLQTLSTKYRLQQENKTMPVNFLRHYYDVYKLLENERVLKFLGSPEYVVHKQSRFRTQDIINIKENPAFTLKDPEIRNFYSDEFKRKSAMYFGIQPAFEEILQRINKHMDLL